MKAAVWLWLLGISIAIVRAAEPDPNAPLTPLTTARQVLDLGVEGARRSPHPVKLTAVVTYPFFLRTWFYAQDETGGVLVVLNDPAVQPAAGQLVEITGRAAPGAFSAQVSEAGVRVLGTAPFPEPIRTDLARLEAGAEFGQWIAIEGRVVDIVLHPQQLSLLLASGEHRIVANLRLDAPMELPADWMGARVEVRGVCWTIGDDANRTLGFRIHSPGTDTIRILEPGNADAFDRPLQTAGSLQSATPASDARVRLAGTVTLFQNRAHLFLQDDTGSAHVRFLGPLWTDRQHPNLNPLNILTFSAKDCRTVDHAPLVALQPGDRVEVVGTPVPSAFAPSLAHAEYRLLGHGPPPAPVSIELRDLGSGKHDGQLISVRAGLLDRVTRRIGSIVLDTLMLEGSERPAHATLTSDHTSALPALERGSFLHLTGICTTEEGEWKTVRSTTLLLRHASDVRVVGPPPLWATWKVGRILSIASVLGLAALGWIWLLRRRVEKRTRDLERTKEELGHALAQERELGRLKSNFVNLVSHEFRTPLGIVMSATENLENYLDRLQPAERAELLADIRTSTQRMSGLMQEVLLLARVDAGKLACKPAPLDLRAFLERLIEEVRSASDHACMIEFSIAPEAVAACADEALLRHTFTNLLTNAVKYSSLGQPVHFRVERDGDAAVFTVRDEGIGIPDADRRQIFQTFHRGSNVGERPGTGLGLVIVKRCVDLYGGTLQLESKLNAGTTVTVSLPLFENPKS